MKKQEYDKKIILYALIPGLGQFKNGQKKKGAIFLTIFGLFASNQPSWNQCLTRIDHFRKRTWHR